MEDEIQKAVARQPAHVDRKFLLQPTLYERPLTAGEHLVAIHGSADEATTFSSRVLRKRKKPVYSQFRHRRCRGFVTRIVKATMRRIDRTNDYGQRMGTLVSGASQMIPMQPDRSSSAGSRGRATPAAICSERLFNVAKLDGRRENRSSFATLPPAASTRTK